MRKQKYFIGGRIVKTGIAAFITAFICYLLNWPAMFAVITAIVTIEPTAADSIRKAFVRFPASAIGALFAVIFTYFLGDSPLSYGFVTLFTIIVCSKLKLHDGILVATLTGVAMISTVHDEYLTSFFVRLGTTSLGLVVSTIVNIFLMPPKYSQTITNGIQILYKNAFTILTTRIEDFFKQKHVEKELILAFQNLKKDLNKMETLCRYQFKEWHFHRYTREEMRSVRYEFKKLSLLRQIVFHMENLFHLHSNDCFLSTSEQKLVQEIVQLQKDAFLKEQFEFNESYYDKINELSKWFIKEKLDQTGEHFHLGNETSLLYEILSINDLIEELHKIHSLELRHAQLLHNNVAEKNSN
ncbi:aromatic acid exporter family protein [Salirhabdus sp. Marseille-P4669]|uniref:aromatic acid exporter family protein n=1 Tax=Salirhabdus sp. Marseille-P4669 TaxID=2042310 RepID=UPI000C7C69AD|nr:aromatic acid exporter family protein [Salirhabdus sp. Marseille-P4669]